MSAIVPELPLLSRRRCLYPNSTQASPVVPNLRPGRSAASSSLELGAARWRDREKICTMAQFKIRSPGLPARPDTARHLIEQAGVVLVYLGIVATFAAVSLIACVIWLLIW